MIKKKNLNILSLEKRLMLDAAAVAAISNPIFHFDASDIDADGDTLDQPANGTAISTFHDDKGVDNVASAGGSARPTYQENIFDTGLGGIVFDGINDEFTMGTTTEINNAVSRKNLSLWFLKQALIHLVIKLSMSKAAEQMV